MVIERLKNSKRNVAFGLINKVVILVCPFIIRAVIIKLLGAEYMGMGSLFTSILSVLNLAELGLGSAMVFSMYKPLASDDLVTIRAILNLYKKVYRIIGCIVLGIGLILLPFVQYLILESAPEDINLQLLFAIYLADTAVTYFVFPYSGCVLSAIQRTDIENNVTSIVYTVMYGVQIAFLYIFKNYYAYIILQPIFNTALCLIKVIVVTKLYPQFYCEGKVDKELSKDITSRVKALFGHKIGTVMLSSVDSIIISIFLGLTELAKYNNYYLIHAGVLSVLQVGYNAVKAGVGNSIVTEDKEKNLRDFKKLTFMNSCVVGLCAVCLSILYNRFMFIWMGGVVADETDYIFRTLIYDNSMVVAICAYFYLNAMRHIVLTYKDAAGIWREDAAKPYVESVVKLILTIILINTPLGVMGVVVASIAVIGLISGPWETVVLMRSFFGMDGKGIVKYYLTYILYSVVSVGIAVGAYFLCTYVAPGYTVAELIIRAAIAVFLPVAVYCAVYFRKWEFRSCVDSLKLRLKRK